jgi:membrane-associated protein
MNLVWHFIDICLHLDKHLDEWAAGFGPWLYVIMFVVIFCETGLVVTPLLPGDSLLFAFGAVAAREASQINIALSIGLLIVAAVAGDAVNYAVGAMLGPRVFHYEDSRLLNKKYLMRTHEFYEKYGGKTIVLARFVPIVRTFAPFIAGIGKMGYRRFWVFNFVGAATWVPIFLMGGYYFGNLAVIKRNFHFVIAAILVISVMPMVVDWYNARRAKQSTAAEIAARPVAERVEVEQ